LQKSQNNARQNIFARVIHVNSIASIAHMLAQSHAPDVFRAPILWRHARRERTQRVIPRAAA
jgi:hypothetical protein